MPGRQDSSAYQPTSCMALELARRLDADFISGMKREWRESCFDIYNLQLRIHGFLMPAADRLKQMFTIEFKETNMDATQNQAGTDRGDGEALIRLEGVTKVFVTDEVETHALSGIHLDIEKGEYVSIAGPSGCGKSTLLSILGLLDSPSEGKYWLNGTPVENLDLSDRARIRNREVGFIFQSFNLIGDLTVYENVELPLTYRGMPSGERKKRSQEALEKVGMSHRMKHYPSQLSGGQQQRVAVARALVGDPSVLLADEPTGNLDSKNGEAVMELMRELHRVGATIVMVTHDPRFARYAGRTVNLFDGQVVEESEEQRAAATPQ
jgi:putative ABC transport system ATP-binding protein